ncbi:mediator of RNA polymerase II transcription subunit 20-like [Gigantopelta aegis]|uniref:mediator of RNA polymerase II transcription subunit 20-like n=1 Tax=Gigantopelta aegis TaxID=1735272 RepID=UPI001B888546|nr:mediator of RNA polymerase II transcription subunit 20-like [Gigantopelta aegis]
MGVVCVYPYQVQSGKSSQQALDILQKQVEQLGAIKSGNYYVDCETFQSNLQNVAPKHVNILHNSEQPASCFAVMDSGLCLVADALFDGLMQKIKNYYQPSKGAKIEVRGQRYELGDFIIKTGSVMLTSSFKGILVEVEYGPCVVLGDCWNLLKELLQSIIGNAAESPPPLLKSKMDATYTPSDTILQYLEHFSNCKKMAVTSPTAPSR